MGKLLRTAALVLVFAMAFSVAAMANPGSNPNSGQGQGVSSMIVDGVKISVSGGGSNLEFDVVIIATNERVDVVRAGNGRFKQDIHLPDGSIITVDVHGNSLVQGSAVVTPAPTPAEPERIYRITMTMPRGYPPFSDAEQSSVGRFTVNLGDTIPWDKVFEHFHDFVRAFAPLAQHVKPENLKGWRTHPGATSRPAQYVDLFENNPTHDVPLISDMFIYGVGSNAKYADLNLYPIFSEEFLDSLIPE